MSNSAGYNRHYRELDDITDHRPRQRALFKAVQCDDGRWMVHDDGDVIAFADEHDAEIKAHRIASALNAMA